MTFNKDSKLQDFIVTKEDVVPEEICDEIIKEYEEDTWHNSITLTKIDNYRTCQQVDISSHAVMGNSERRHQLDQIIFEKISPVVVDYAKYFKGFLMYQEDSGYVLLKYKPGDYYKEHTDDPQKNLRNPDGSIVQEANETKRQVTLIIQLNENFEGGGLSFFGDTYRTKIKKGSVILFPSNYLFPHQALPVTKGTRYSLITWMS